ncbi:VOC family protein [Chitinophaga nivalis]|uniref:VOC family protein n=1 Tax=Chitinophaga nivalis TaxID=2991709 RepID=A0ABT3IK38_9BACT|nr:VOC family protein [Chitinophaga nivalis]MCW3465984.1 VOC family protein [Chitinophaga nivalis]MCW3484325.1 VOC family protein [Chitinophaga nivalis]
MASLNPYLTFTDNCEAAFNFYKSVFGGEFLTISRFSEAPADCQGAPEESNKIMHVALQIGPESILMGSDKLASFGPVISGDGFSISVGTDTDAEADKLFNGLSAGGTIIMPIGKTFWGSYFGMFTDKFGVQWMVSCDQCIEK